MEIIIGTKAWSTWSMRPWLVLKATGAEFTETLVQLRQENGLTRQALLAYSPTGLAPALKVDGVTITDSLAICEFLAERFPQARLWPADWAARALMRSAVAEMHSGFSALRNEAPMDLAAPPTRRELSPQGQADVRRIVALWNGLLSQFGGPWLGGADWGIADAYYTPVATRLRTYGVRLADFGDSGAAEDLCRRLLERPEFQAWLAGI